jgi:membrane-associated phospholipid phosphatase
MKTNLQILLGSILFIGLELAVFYVIDQPLAHYMRDADAARPDIINIFRFITDFAEAKWYLCPVGIILIGCWFLLRKSLVSADIRQRIGRLVQPLMFFFLTIAVSGIVTNMIKPLLGRARPVESDRSQAYGFDPIIFDSSWHSMPSGHATTAAALAMTLTILFPRGRLVWWGVGMVLAFSRVVVNAHYLSDVLAGIVVGVLATLWVDRQRDHQGMFPQLKGIFPIDKS